MNKKLVVLALVAGLSIGIDGVSAQTQPKGQPCRASVSKGPVTVNTDEERAWDIAFDVSVATCSGRGSFAFVVDVDALGKTESNPITLPFELQKSGTSRVTMTFKADNGKPLKSVHSIAVRECTCPPPPEG